MSDTKTLEQRQYEAQMAANDANSNLEFANGEIQRQAKRFADLMASPDFQQMVLALWEGARTAHRKSGLSMEDFAKTLFVTEVKVTAQDDHTTHLRLLQEREASFKAHALQVTREAMEHATAKAMDDAKLMGVNSVARGAGERQRSWHSGRIESALDDLHRALLEKRADPCPLHMVVEVDRSAMNALAAEYRMRWSHLPKEEVHDAGGGAFQVNVPGGTILVREKK